jgi:hypothetical protein
MQAILVPFLVYRALTSILGSEAKAALTSAKLAKAVSKSFMVCSAAATDTAG